MIQEYKTMTTVWLYMYVVPLFIPLGFLAILLMAWLDKKGWIHI